MVIRRELVSSLKGMLRFVRAAGSPAPVVDIEARKGGGVVFTATADGVDVQAAKDFVAVAESGKCTVPLLEFLTVCDRSCEELFIEQDKPGVLSVLRNGIRAEIKARPMKHGHGLIKFSGDRRIFEISPRDYVGLAVVLKAEDPFTEVFCGGSSLGFSTVGGTGVEIAYRHRSPEKLSCITKSAILSELGRCVEPRIQFEDHDLVVRDSFCAYRISHCENGHKSSWDKVSQSVNAMDWVMVEGEAVSEMMAKAAGDCVEVSFDGDRLHLGDQSLIPFDTHVPVGRRREGVQPWRVVCRTEPASRVLARVRGHARIGPSGGYLACVWIGEGLAAALIPGGVKAGIRQSGEGYLLEAAPP